MSRRILGIDHGDAHTGLAVSDPLGITAQPKGTVHEKDAASVAARVAEVARSLDVETIVVGLPVNMNGTEGPRAKRARAFGASLEKELGLRVTYWDERLTTAQAGRALRGRKSAKRRAKIDVVSAQVMLQSYLDAAARGKLTGEGGPPPEGGAA
jgi:putative Holliday junction resolvase